MNKEIRKFLNDHLSVVEFKYEAINKGGSDRSFYRVFLPGRQSFIFMAYGTEVEENAYWAEINRFMTDLNILVPRIIAYDYRQHFLLLEDLGEVDLWSQSHLSWSHRRLYYFRALSQIERLHSFPLVDLPANLKLSKGYDRQLYLWEHNYFKENFVQAVCHLELSESFLHDWSKESEALIDRLQQIEPRLIHRDFQSQNIMIKNEQPVLIDFQGMRQGNLFYDLGSLICDPYVILGEDERNDLISFYYRIMQPSYGLREFTANFWEAAAQRLMQALGAYGFLGLKKNKPDFLKHIDNGIRNLLTATTHATTLPVLQELSDLCIKKLAKDKT